MDVDDVIEIFTQLLLEKKILLVSIHKSLLTQVAVALNSLMFPLDWKHTLIPILPCSMISTVDAPFPYLIGIQTQIWNEAIKNQLVDLTSEVTIVYLDNQKVETSELSS